MIAHSITIILDLILLVSAILALYFRPRIGGQLAVGLRLIMVGVFVLGVTHLADTMIHEYVTSVDADMLTLWHHGLNLAGFLFIFAGFFQMKRAIEA